MPFKKNFYGKSDVGRRRQINEDSFYCSELDALCVVADGMGGHSFGEIASKMAIENIKEYVQDNIHSLSFSAEDGKEEVFRRLSEEIQRATTEANENIYGCLKRERKNKRMGTTLVMLYFFRDYAFVAHVGDSRGYILRNGKLYQITEDHTVVNRWLKTKQISQEEAERYRNSPNSKYVTRALGTKLGIKADIKVQKVQHNDLYLLCSDGLTDLISDEEICKTMLEFQDGLSRLAKTLISMANARGGKDNITVVLARLIDAEIDAREETEVYYRNGEEPSTEVFVRNGNKFSKREI